MNNEDPSEHYADFISYYRDRMEGREGYQELWKLNKEFSDQAVKLDRQAGKQIEEHHLRPHDFHAKQTLDVSASRNALQEEYKGKTDKLARSHGFKGMSYDDHMAEQKLQQNIAAAVKQNPNTPLTKEQEHQAFLLKLKDASKGLTKGKERER